MGEPGPSEALAETTVGRRDGHSLRLRTLGGFKHGRVFGLGKVEPPHATFLSPVSLRWQGMDRICSRALEFPLPVQQLKTGGLRHYPVKRVLIGQLGFHVPSPSNESSQRLCPLREQDGLPRGSTRNGWIANAASTPSAFAIST